MAPRLGMPAALVLVSLMPTKQFLLLHNNKLANMLPFHFLLMKRFFDTTLQCCRSTSSSSSWLQWCTSTSTRSGSGSDGLISADKRCFSMKKINEFYGIIFKRVMPELSDLCC